jgi:sorbitol-specific phosphotransferase system component IIBC
MSFLTHRTGRIVYPAGTFVTWVLPALVVLAFTLKWSRLSGLLGIALIVSLLVLEPVLDSGWEIAQLVLPAAQTRGLAAGARMPVAGEEQVPAT